MIFYLFEEKSYWESISTYSEPIKNLKGILEDQGDVTIWMPPSNLKLFNFNKESHHDIKFLKTLSGTFNFKFSESSMIPFSKNILVFSFKNTGSNESSLSFLSKELNSIPISVSYVKNNKKSVDLIRTVISTFMILKNKFSNPSLPKKEISLWFPIWSQEKDRFGLQITDKMITNMCNDLTKFKGIKNIYLANSDKIFPNTKSIISFPKWEKKEILSVDIIIDYCEDWEPFPKINLDTSCQEILISIIDSDSIGPYQKPGSVRLNYSGPEDLALFWFLNLVF